VVLAYGVLYSIFGERALPLPAHCFNGTNVTEVYAGWWTHHI
jgi:hypothetical protein